MVVFVWTFGALENGTLVLLGVPIKLDVDMWGHKEMRGGWKSLSAQVSVHHRAMVIYTLAKSAGMGNGSATSHATT